MNYIKRLQAENAALELRIAAGLDALTAIQALISSSKFTGTDEDGSRRDWISTGDVHALVSNVKSDLRGQA